MAGGKHILGKAKRHIFGTAKVGEKGQIVIPKDARQIFGVKPGDTLLILGDEETGIIVTKTCCATRQMTFSGKWRNRGWNLRHYMNRSA